MKIESITITRQEGGDFTVNQGERYTDHLTRDEALWCAVEFIKDGCSAYLKTKEQWTAYEAWLLGMRTKRELSETERLLPLNAGS